MKRLVALRLGNKFIIRIFTPEIHDTTRHKNKSKTNFRYTKALKQEQFRLKSNFFVEINNTYQV